MVLLVASQIHLGKLSETGNVAFFSMRLSSTKSVCNSVFVILTPASPFSSTFEFFCYELTVNYTWLIIDHSQENLWGLEYTRVLI